MTNLIRCDGCGMEMRTAAPRLLELRSVNARLTSDPDEWHFCSFDCVATWARVRAERDAARQSRQP